MTLALLPAISSLCGWVYTISWSLSFYPQPILNYTRHSTTGTTIDFPLINILGFIGYLLSNAFFLYSPLIRSQYAIRNQGLYPTVRFNDVVFAAHAVVLSAVCLSQFWPRLWGFERRKGRGTKPSWGILGVGVGCVLGVGVVVLIVLIRQDPDPKDGWAWIDVVYAFSYTKVLITLIKYMPQVLTNHRNRSTNGWSIFQILLDFIGGILSITQLGIDSWLQGDWSGVTGNPVKLALGNISLFFDVVFMLQHFCLYGGHRGMGKVGEEEALLGDDEGRRVRESSME